MLDLLRPLKSALKQSVAAYYPCCCPAGSSSPSGSGGLPPPPGGSGGGAGGPPSGLSSLCDDFEPGQTPNMLRVDVVGAVNLTTCSTCANLDGTYFVPWVGGTSFNLACECRWGLSFPVECGNVGRIEICTERVQTNNGVFWISMRFMETPIHFAVLIVDQLITKAPPPPSNLLTVADMTNLSLTHFIGPPGTKCQWDAAASVVINPA